MLLYYDYKKQKREAYAVEKQKTIPYGSLSDSA